MCLDYLAEGSERSINTHMKNIRAKLGSVEWIETIRGFGYRFLGKVVGK
jgi:two-component system phosphate regulon response regulator PhoB